MSEGAFIESIAHAIQRIAQLEEALREARAVLHEILSGQEDSPLVSWEVMENIDAALSGEARRSQKER